LVLVVDNTSLQMRQTFKGEIVHAKLWIDQGNLCLRGRIGTGNSENDVLHQNGLSAAGRASDEGVRSIRLRRQKEEVAILFLDRNQQVVISGRTVREASLPTRPANEARAGSGARLQSPRRQARPAQK
jgi:hypothetical protein